MLCNSSSASFQFNLLHMISVFRHIIQKTFTWVEQKWGTWSLSNLQSIIWLKLVTGLLFKRRPHEMVKHTQTIPRQIDDELFECVWPFCGDDLLNVFWWNVWSFFNGYLKELMPNFNIFIFSLLHFFCLRSGYMTWTTFYFVHWTFYFVYWKFHCSSDWIDWITSSSWTARK